jgi:hypothetical protein
MTAGERIKKELGLENLEYVVISRTRLSSYRIYFVWYDTYRTKMPITNWRIRQNPNVAGIFDGDFIAMGKARRPAIIPPMRIESFDGSLAGSLIIPVDLAGDNFIQPKNYSKKVEAIQLKDLNKNKGISDFGKYHLDIRKDVMKSETGQSKLVITELVDNKHVDFVFSAPSTDIYPEDFIYKEAPIENDYTLKKDLQKEYIITIRVLNVVDWLETYPDKTEITRADIKEILDTAFIEVDSSVPAFYWQGGAYWLQQLGGTIYKNPIIAPQFWNRDDLHGDGNFFIDKITQRIFNQIGFYEQQMASALQKALKEQGYL